MRSSVPGGLAYGEAPPVRLGRHEGARMKGPAGVTALVLAETVAGGPRGRGFSPPPGHGGRGGFSSPPGAVSLLPPAPLWSSASVGLVEGDDAGRWAVRFAAALALGTALWLGMMFTRWQPAARAVGLVCIPVSVGPLLAPGGAPRGPGGA